MRDGKAVVVGVLSILVGLVIGGATTFLLLGPPAPPTRAKSAFYTACRDWSPIDEMGVLPKDVLFENKALPPSLTESVVGQRLHHTSRTSRAVSATEEGIDQFMRALRTKLKTVALRAGAGIDAEGEGAAVDGYLSGFDMEYTSGNAFGTVEADIDGGEAHPEKAGVKTYRLSVEIEEWVP